MFLEQATKPSPTSSPLLLVGCQHGATELGNEASELQLCRHFVSDAHVCKANDLEEAELDWLRHLLQVIAARHAEQGAHNV